MLIWFVALSCAGVLLVFGDPGIDYRMVAAGSLLPDVIDGISRRGVGPAHTLLGAVGLLVVSMLATVGRRPLRKRLVMVSIGVFAHLVLDAVWSKPALFWWPLSGGELDGPVPSFGRGPVVIAQEVIGVVVLVWFARRCGLDRRSRWAGFVRTGRLER